MWSSFVARASSTCPGTESIGAPGSVPRSRQGTFPGLEPDPHGSRIVHAQHRLLQEVILVESPERLDLDVALLARLLRVEEHEDEAGLLHDLTVGLAELALPGEQREPVGEAGRDRDVEELLELLGAHLRQVRALAAEEQLGPDERIALEPRGVLLRRRGRCRRRRADTDSRRLQRRTCLGERRGRDRGAAEERESESNTVDVLGREHEHLPFREWAATGSAGMPG